MDLGEWVLKGMFPDPKQKKSKKQKAKTKSKKELDNASV